MVYTFQSAKHKCLKGPVCCLNLFYSLQQLHLCHCPHSTLLSDRYWYWTSDISILRVLWTIGDKMANALRYMIRLICSV